MPSIDSRFYFSVENSDQHSSQIYWMALVNSISTIVNFILFYLILMKSDKENKEYRYVLFFHNFSLYFAQFFWGSVINMVFLLPFPAVYSLGFLKYSVNCFYLGGVWFLLFGWSALMMFMVLLVRLRFLARPDSVFKLSSKSYKIIIFSLCLYVFIPIFVAWIPGYSNFEFTKSYVKKYYPNCLKALDIPGIFINTSEAAILALTIASLGLLGSGALIYLFLCLVIIVEIQKQCFNWSTKKTNHHKKVLYDTIVQNIVKCVFLGGAPVVELLNVFLDPSTDTIAITMLANIFFVAAPIPCTIVMFCQNRSYRNFFIRSLKTVVPEQTRVENNNNQTLNLNSKF